MNDDLLCEVERCFEEALEGFGYCEEHLLELLDDQEPWDDIDYDLEEW